MKRILSVALAASMLTTAGTFTAFAEETAVPADVDEAVYAQLMEDGSLYDRNGDGILTDEELRQIRTLDLKLDGVKDLLWVKKLPECTYLSLEGGSLTDFSALKEMTGLRYLHCKSVPLSDITFIKDMQLRNCELEDMEQITLEQRLAVLQRKDVTIEEGYSVTAGAEPAGLLDGHTVEITIDDPEVAEFLNRRYDANNEICGIYGKTPGTTSYHMSVDKQECLSGSITVTPLQRITPALYQTVRHPKAFESFYYGSNYMILNDSVLYGIKDGTLYQAEEDIKDVSRTYKENAADKYVYIDLALRKDGTLLMNGTPAYDLTFDSLHNGCALTADGALYEIYPSQKDIVPVLVGNGCERLIESSHHYYVNTDGELIWYFISYSSDGTPKARTEKTGIQNPKDISYDLFLDGDGTLWKCSSYRTFSKKKVAENVKDAGYHLTSAGYTDYVYQKEDGNWYTVYEGKQVEVYETTELPTAPSCKDSGSFYIHAYDTKYGDGSDLLINWFLLKDDTLTIDLAGQHFAISDVAQVIGAEYVEKQEQGFAWFIRTDGSVWRYCFETQTATEMPMAFDYSTELVRGDANGDGALTVADIILFQKWLLGIPGTELAIPEAAEFCVDGVLDIYDLALMKRELLIRNMPARLTLTTDYGGFGVMGQDLGHGSFTTTYGIEEGDTFIECHDGHWERNPEQDYGTPILKVDAIRDGKVTFTGLLGGEEKQQTVSFGEVCSEAVSSTNIVFDGINFSYTLTFSGN